MTIKAIIDTNVIVSGIFWKGAPFEVLEAWQKRRFLPAVFLPILNEYRRVVDEMTKKRPSPVLGSILEVIELHSEMVEPVSFTRTVCSDPDDDKFLEAALAADADYVVSGDAALLSLKNHHGIRIVSQVTTPLAFKAISGLSRRRSCFTAQRQIRTVVKT